MVCSFQYLLFWSSLPVGTEKGISELISHPLAVMITKHPFKDAKVAAVQIKTFVHAQREEVLQEESKQNVINYNNFIREKSVWLPQ